MTNRYDFAPETVRAIRDELGFALDAWGYDLPVVESATVASTA